MVCSRQVHLVVSNPNEAQWYSRFWQQVEQGRVEKWTATRQFEVGDLVLFYFSSPEKAIMAVGIVDSAPVPLDPAFPRQDETPRVFCNFEPVKRLEHPVSFSDFGDLPKKLAVRGTGRVAEENVGVLVQKIARNNPDVEKLAGIYA